jgi:hypothetical protein
VKNISLLTELAGPMEGGNYKYATPDGVQKIRQCFLKSRLVLSGSTFVKSVTLSIWRCVGVWLDSKETRNEVTFDSPGFSKFSRGSEMKKARPGGRAFELIIPV